MEETQTKKLNLKALGHVQNNEQDIKNP